MLTRKLVVNPFVSEAQRRWMHANHPEMAERWEEHTPKGKKLPKRKRPTTNKRRVSRLDPTRTITLRRSFSQVLRKQFAQLKGELVRLIVVEDAFGLKRKLAANYSPDQPRDSYGRFGETAEAVGEGKVGAALSFAKNLPGNVLQRIRDKAKAKYDQLEQRYGSRYAKAIVGAALAGLPLPVPGSSFLTAAPVIALAEMHRWLTANAEDLSSADVKRLAEQLIKELKEELTVNVRFAFHSDPDKVKAFQDWLAKQLDKTLRSKNEEELWKRYIEAGFKKGAGRSFDDVRKSDLYKQDPDRTRDFYRGSKDEFLRSSFSQPESLDKVKLLAGRSFDELEDVTREMSNRMSRSLTDGLVQGKHPNDIAKDLSEDLDVSRSRAETIARTEIIRAHAEGQLSALESLGVEDVGVAVEFSNSEDNSVCPQCDSLEGVVLRIAEAHGVIPVHPNCRCAFLPSNVNEDEDGQKRSKSKIEDAFDEAGVEPPDIDKSRPQSIFNVESIPLPVYFAQDLAEFSRLTSTVLMGGLDVNAFNPNQPRDAYGKFTSGKDDGSLSTWLKDSVVKSKVYRGSEHDILQPPVFVTKKAEDAAEYGNVHEGHVRITNPLELENAGKSDILVKLAKDAGITDFVTYPEGDVYSATLEELSPSGQGNHLPDLLYHPKVREGLLKAGYDGLHFRDQLWEDHIETWVALRTDQVRMIPVANAFCKTGEGGGVDPTCGKEKYVGETVGKKEKDHADKVEKEVAAAVKGTWEENNKFYDVKVGSKDFLEVKSMLKGSKTSISVHPDALLRKVKGVRDGTFHTVVVDERGTFDGGAYKDRYSGNRMYYKRGSGRYSLSQMHQVGSEAELRRLLKTPDAQLPEKAKGSLPKDVDKLREDAAKAHESRLRKDRARKARLKAEGKSAYERQT